MPLSVPSPMPGHARCVWHCTPPLPARTLSPAPLTMTHATTCEAGPAVQLPSSSDRPSTMSVSSELRALGLQGCVWRRGVSWHSYTCPASRGRRGTTPVGSDLIPCTQVGPTCSERQAHRPHPLHIRWAYLFSTTVAILLRGSTWHRICEAWREEGSMSTQMGPGPLDHAVTFSVAASILLLSMVMALVDVMK